MATSSSEAISSLRRSTDETERLVEGLDPDDLLMQSGAAEWTVAQVLSHLGSASELTLATVTTGHDDPERNPAVWDKWNSMPPAEQAANFVASSRRLMEEIDSLSDDEVATKTFKLSFLPAPVDIGFVVGMRLNEVALHRWDVEVAFDPEATVATYLVPTGLERLGRFAGHIGKPIGRDVIVAVETFDPELSFLLESGDGGVSLTAVDSPPAEAGTRVRMPAEAFLRLIAGRLSPAHTPAGVEIEGELGVEDLRRMFPGM